MVANHIRASLRVECYQKFMAGDHICGFLYKTDLVIIILQITRKLQRVTIMPLGTGQAMLNCTYLRF